MIAHVGYKRMEYLTPTYRLPQADSRKRVTMKATIANLAERCADEAAAVGVDAESLDADVIAGLHGARAAMLLAGCLRRLGRVRVLVANVQQGADDARHGVIGSVADEHANSSLRAAAASVGGWRHGGVYRRARSSKTGPAPLRVRN
jgi:hypothetical protein